MHMALFWLILLLVGFVGYICHKWKQYQFGLWYHCHCWILHCEFQCYLCSVSFSYRSASIICWKISDDDKNRGKENETEVWYFLFFSTRKSSNLSILTSVNVHNCITIFVNENNHILIECLLYNFVWCLTAEMSKLVWITAWHWVGD